MILSRYATTQRVYAVLRDVVQENSPLVLDDSEYTILVNAISDGFVLHEGIGEAVHQGYGLWYVEVPAALRAANNSLAIHFIATIDEAPLEEAVSVVVNCTIVDQPITATHGTPAAVTSTTVTLNSDAVATADYYKGAIIEIVVGAGAGQARRITGYSVGRVATVDTAWATNPNTTTSRYIIHGRNVNSVNDVALVAQSQISTSIAQFDTSTVEDTAAARSLARMVAASPAGKWVIVDDELRVYKADGSTVWFTKTLTATEGVDPTTALT